MYPVSPISFRGIFLYVNSPAQNGRHFMTFEIYISVHRLLIENLIIFSYYSPQKKIIICIINRGVTKCKRRRHNRWKIAVSTSKAISYLRWQLWMRKEQFFYEKKPVCGCVILSKSSPVTVFVFLIFRALGNRSSVPKWC